MNCNLPVMRHCNFLVIHSVNIAFRHYVVMCTMVTIGENTKSADKKLTATEAVSIFF